MEMNIRNMLPGISDIRETVEGQTFFGPWEYNKAFIVPATLSGAARDAGHSVTTTLRPGLLMGKVTSTGKWKEWNPTGTDGSEYIGGVLLYAENVQSYGADTDKWFGYILMGGCVRIAGLIVPGQASAGLSGQALSRYIRSIMGTRFVFDDYGSSSEGMAGFAKIRHITGSVTLTDVDNNSLITTLGASGAVTVTLPAVAASQGFHCQVFNAVDQNLIIAGPAAGTLITFNNAAAASVAFQTSSQKIGGAFEIYGLNNAKYGVFPTGSNTVTVA